MSDMPVPPVWFRLPPGFHDIGPEDRAALDGVVGALGSPDAQRQLAQLMDRLDELSMHHVVHTAIGMHPDEPVGVSTSLFSLTVRRAEHPNARLAVARTALTIAQSPLWSTSRRRFIELPSSSPCCMVAGTLDLPEAVQPVFQARVATAHPDGQHVLVLDLTSAAIQHAAAYTDILEAITHTLAFADPGLGPPCAARPSRITEALL